MGRKAKPTNLKLLQGTNRKDRENKNEPEVPPGIPPQPKHLSKIAVAEWNRMSSLLLALGLLTEIDMASLAAYCQAYGRWAEAEVKINESSIIVKTTNGNIIQNPLVGIANQAMEHMRKHLIEFGMTPASRAKVSSNKAEKKKDEWADF